MRLIDADALMKDVCDTRCGCTQGECEYDYNGEKYCEPYQYINYAPTIDAVPLKPLAKWLARYAAPPGLKAREIVNEPAETITELCTELWVEFLQEMNWEDEA